MVSVETVVVFFVASLLVLFFNVGIPNELKGCLFFVQVCIYMSCADYTAQSSTLICYRLWDLSMRVQTE